ncbi:MAG: hypothetical protein MJ234_03960 [bacterium]|nr:hypothetical protein [bacterium]
MIKLSKTLIAGAALLSTAILYGCTEPQTLNFEYKASKGASREYDFSSETKMQMENAGSKEAQEMTISFNVAEDILDVNDKNERKTNYRIKNAKIAKVEDGKTQEMPMSNLNDQVLTIKSTAKGVLTELNGTEISGDAAAMAAPEFIPLIPFDDNQISVGQTWEKSTETSNKIPPYDTVQSVNVKTVYTFTGYEKYKTSKVAKITEKTESTQKTVTNPPKPKEGQEEVPSITTTVTGTIEGTILFDTKEGIIVKTEKVSKQNSAMTIKMKSKKDENGEAQAMKDQTFKRTSESKITLVLADTDSSKDSNKEESKTESKDTEKK